MGRYRGVETPELRQRLIAQGLGQGTGSEYQPWIRVGDFPNRGESFRAWCFKTGRTHHYHSVLEYRHHFVAEMQEEVDDIREQYPYLPMEETVHLASRLGIAHPSFGGQLNTLTIDSLLTIDDGRAIRHCARSIKYTKDLIVPRYQEILELERQSSLQRGYLWQLLTEKELTQTLEKNLRWLRKWMTVNRGTPDDDLQDRFIDAFCNADLSLTLGRILEGTAKRLAVSRLLAIHLFRHAAWTRAIRVDLYAPLQLTKSHVALLSNQRPKRHTR
ncbi:MAG: TnsA endonuclease N-terminal domain-containing protein [Rhodocyclaceae bacterium]|jgi:hypothetical protein|nr:TnsA endonuclease N-terminal domain-containing protein [Zoogloeaceae bacterium]MCW5595956.1 TnsA endonuclease N-terminal domain-containing protein [Rhodocyclaceae bacterium]